MAKRIHRVAYWHKLLSQEACVTCCLNCSHNGGVVEFLRIVNFVSAGNTSRVIMPELDMMVLDGANDIAFHDLHVVNVVQEFYAR